MRYRHIQQKIRGKATQDGAGVSLTRIIGHAGIKRVDPFLLLDFFGSDNPNDYIAGFPAHPHRGFQTVTYMLAGKMRHRDSVGNEGVIDEGGLQWMNAGRGIIHEEIPQQTNGLLKGFQLWVNLPSKEKMSAPAYQDIAADAVPWVNMNSGLAVKVLAGRLDGVTGPVTTEAVTPLFYDLHWHNNQSVEVTLAIPQGFNCFIYCYEGDMEVGDEHLSLGELAVLTDGSQVKVNAKHTAKAILVAGQPLNEPIVQHGPFVMNTQTEIDQAIADYQTGKFTH
jgi:redox-sensitive bicupin YhaK (pirin superfamily)